jgi:hypothetical protein
VDAAIDKPRSHRIIFGFGKNKIAFIGLIIILFLIFVAIFAEYL